MLQRQRKGGSQGQPPLNPGEGTSGGRNQTITTFFKPSQKPGTCLLKTPPRGSSQNESFNLLSPPMSCGKSSTPKRRRNLPMQSPSKSPIMEAFLRRGKMETDTIVSGLQTRCANCNVSLLSPKVVLNRLSLPFTQLYVDLKCKEEVRKLIRKPEDRLIRSVNKICKGRPERKCLRESGASQVSVCFDKMETPLCKAKICSPQLLVTSVAPKLLVAHEKSQKRWKQKKDMVQQTFYPGQTSSGSDEVMFQVNGNSKWLTLAAQNSGKNSEKVCAARKSMFSSNDLNKTSSPTSLSNYFTSSESTGASYTCTLNGRDGELSNGLSMSQAEQRTNLLAGAFTIGTNSSCHSPHNTDPFSFSNGSTCIVGSAESTEGILEELNSCTDNVNVPTNCNSKYSLLINSDSLSEAEMSSDRTSGSQRKRRRKRNSSLDSDESFYCPLPSSDEEEESLQPLDEIMRLVSKPVAATPEKPSLNQSQLSYSQSPVKKISSRATLPVSYVNSLDNLLKEKMERERLVSNKLCEIEKKLCDDLEQGMGLPPEYTSSFEEGELAEEHQEFVNKYSVVTNVIPDENPGEDIFQLDMSRKIFNHSTLDLRTSSFSSQSPEEILIFKCDLENQLLLATQGFFGHVYRFKKCPALLMKWLFQMSSVHPSYIVSMKILNTLMEITCNNISYSEAHGSLWTPSVLDVATVFANMGISFQTLFPLPQLQPTFTGRDLVSAVPSSSIPEENPCNDSKQVYNHIPVMHLTHVIKFLGFCTTVHPESFDDQETLLLLVMLLKMYLEKRLRHTSVVDLHSLVKNLLRGIKEWDVKMPELCTAICQLSNHHHNYVKLVQLVPASDLRGRQLRRHLGLMCISKLLDQDYTSIPTNYDSQMIFLCNSMEKMKPSTLIKKMQSNPESDCTSDLEQEAYYLTFSLLNLTNDASSSDEHISKQRNYLLKLCIALEKHIKCDIRENARLFYRTKVKDLVARIYGKWQELLQSTRPDQGKLHDYWEPVGSSPGSSQE
ncbi:SMC5-SMC6 complex localization factor protein 2 [Pelobates fuscus]|uniref:SMC5-SMC6 complex localization factor protein 2 n=1 Tax=Pelobates fuscus TaxID=191477 RepID=UPI002FE4B8FA